MITLAIGTIIGLTFGTRFGWWLHRIFAPRRITSRVGKGTWINGVRGPGKLWMMKAAAPPGAPAVTGATIVAELAAPASAKRRRGIKFADWQHEKLEAAAAAQAKLASDGNVEVEYDVVSALENEGYTSIDARRAAHRAFLESAGDFDETFRRAIALMPDRTVPIRKLANA